MSIHSLEPQQGSSEIAAILDQVDSAVSSDRDKRSFLDPANAIPVDAVARITDWPQARIRDR
jgi:hypothetical protein